jgi:hypothetical protein
MPSIGDSTVVYSRLTVAWFARALELAVGFARLDLGARQVRACGQRVGLGLLERRVEELRVEPRDHLALLHGRIEVDQDLLHASGDLAADLHRHQRRQRAGRRDLRHDAAAIDRGRLEAQLTVVLAAAEALPRGVPEACHEHARDPDGDATDPNRHALRAC